MLRVFQHLVAGSGISSTIRGDHKKLVGILITPLGLAPLKWRGICSA
jgi:hypothetical protein